MKPFNKCGSIISIFAILFLVSISKALDQEKVNSTGLVSLTLHGNEEILSDEGSEFSDSSEQLPCSDLRGYAYHNNTAKCWMVGSRGPCPDSMRFYADPENEGFGECDCVPMRNCIGRPRTYWPETDRCYFLYSKGPCSSGHWLIFNKHKKPECRPNICGKQIKHQRSLDFLFPHEGKCHKTGTQGFCGDGETVYISSSDTKPRCYTSKPVCRFLIFTAQTLSCRQGSKLDVTGRCEHMREMHDE